MTSHRTWAGVALVFTLAVGAMVWVSTRSGRLRDAGGPTLAAAAPRVPSVAPPDEPPPPARIPASTPEEHPSMAVAEDDVPVQFEPQTVNIKNEVSQRAEKQWQTEIRGADAAERETYVRELFDEVAVSAMLDSVECRTTLCRLAINVNPSTMQTPGAKSLRGRLGQSVAVLENDGERMVVLVPAADLAPE